MPGRRGVDQAEYQIEVFGRFGMSGSRLRPNPSILTRAKTARYPQTTPRRMVRYMTWPRQRFARSPCFPLPLSFRPFLSPACDPRVTKF